MNTNRHSYEWDPTLTAEDKKHHDLLAPSGLDRTPSPPMLPFTPQVMRSDVAPSVAKPKQSMAEIQAILAGKAVRKRTLSQSSPPSATGRAATVRKSSTLVGDDDEDASW